MARPVGSSGRRPKPTRRRSTARHRDLSPMTTEPIAAPINAWHVAQHQFDLAAERLGMDQGMRRVLREPRRELTVPFPVTMDDGTVQVFTGYRVQHNLGRG